MWGGASVYWPLFRCNRLLLFQSIWFFRCEPLLQSMPIGRHFPIAEPTLCRTHFFCSRVLLIKMTFYVFMWREHWRWATKSVPKSKQHSNWLTEWRHVVMCLWQQHGRLSNRTERFLLSRSLGDRLGVFLLSRMWLSVSENCFQSNIFFFFVCLCNSNRPTMPVTSIHNALCIDLQFCKFVNKHIPNAYAIRSRIVVTLGRRKRRDL